MGENEYLIRITIGGKERVARIRCTQAEVIAIYHRGFWDVADVDDQGYPMSYWEEVKDDRAN